MKMKTLLMVLASAVTALACASASAQFSSNSMQDRTSSRSQHTNAQSASELPLNSLLGAPQDDEETQLPDNHASSSARSHASTQNNQKGNAQADQDSALSPLLGAPEDYERSYISGLGYAPKEQATADEAADYSLTPVERMSAPDPAERGSASSEGAASHSGTVGTRVAGEGRKFQEFQPPTTLTRTSISASQYDSFGATAVSDPTSTIYRPPW
ncbi:hypothetical protein P3T40_006938 [Paraburkholderia sp. EB58]|jgi:hypothetical protein|uniref:hypothetical protein n=1 Tax=Paraburkholderia sp. EB58 TaxID=3035125 RepID=UPI003D21CF90